MFTEWKLVYGDRETRLDRNLVELGCMSERGDMIKLIKFCL